MTFLFPLLNMDVPMAAAPHMTEDEKTQETSISNIFLIFIFLLPLECAGGHTGDDIALQKYVCDNNGKDGDGHARCQQMILRDHASPEFHQPQLKRHKRV